MCAQTRRRREFQTRGGSPASIMPTITSDNTASPEKGAAALIEDRKRGQSPLQLAAAAGA
jgi:hypothetical protein